MSQTSPTSGSSGFTLLEMMIVLALLSLLTIVLTGTILLGVTARARVAAVSSDQQDFASFERITILELGHAYPDWITAGQYKVIDFDGSSDRLAFLAPALDTMGPGLANFWVSVGNSAGQNGVLLRTSLAENGKSTILNTYFALGLASLRFAYFGIPRDGGPPVWQDEWKMRSVPPDMIAIDINFPKGDRRNWPELVIHPEIDADITCEIDAQTHRCAGR